MTTASTDNLDLYRADARGFLVDSFGRIVGTTDGKFFFCVHDHKHRSQATFARCLDGAHGAATGSRLARR